MKTAERIASNRAEAAQGYRGNVVLNALYDVYGDLSTANEQYEACLRSPRFGMLLVIAGHGAAAYERLKLAAIKIANNPATRARI